MQPMESPLEGSPPPGKGGQGGACCSSSQEQWCCHCFPGCCFQKISLFGKGANAGHRPDVPGQGRMEWTAPPCSA
jgi:hypothetical protein